MMYLNQFSFKQAIKLFKLPLEKGEGKEVLTISNKIWVKVFNYDITITAEYLLEYLNHQGDWESRN